MSNNYACCKGCFVCSATEGGVHSGGCCGSTLCSSRGWEKQVKAWLKAEEKFKQNQGAMTTRWLIAEQLYKVQLDEWLDAELQHHNNVEDWLDAEQQYNEQYRRERLMAMLRAERQAEQPVRPPKRVNRVNVPASGRTPKTSATAKVAALAHGGG
jgi:hypothetical protein